MQVPLPSGRTVPLSQLAAFDFQQEYPLIWRRDRVPTLTVTLFIIVTLLMIQLQSFNRLFLLLSVVPMSLIGVVGALLLFNKALGFVAILGVLSLTGMIARNGVILIEQVENERKQGKESWNAVIDAAVSRFRPIMLTAISTVLGLIPIASTIIGPRWLWRSWAVYWWQPCSR